jgi:hypothetical protein
MWFMLEIGLCLPCETERGQLGGCGEYRMGRMRVVYFHVWSSEVVAPPMSINDRSSGPGEQFRLCIDAWDL